MYSLPPFLPPMLNLQGSWNVVLNELYTIFKKDFIESKVFYQNLKVIYDKRKLWGNKEEAFWHLITKEDTKAVRIPAYDRAKRLPWARPTIENHDKPEVKVWDYLEGNGKVRIYLWLENYDYAVILERGKGKRKHLVILITGFYVERWKRKDLLRRYQKRAQNAL